MKNKGNIQGRFKAKESNTHLSKITLITVALGIVIGTLHSQHLYHLFENDRYFSALSSLERDLSFRTEMGLYYSYFKMIVEADFFTTGIDKLIRDNVTEYPDTINTLKRFNLYPEVVLGGGFRLVSKLLTAFQVKSDCYGIQRGQNQPPINTCKGLGEPHYFYIYSVFGLNSLLPVSIFLLSLYLSENLLGGVISVLMFFYNHGEATRVMWTPPLRESFAMPFLFLQLLALTHILKIRTVLLQHYLYYGLSSLLFLLPWQFSQFCLLTQVLSLQALYSLRLLPVNKFLGLLLTLAVMLLLNAALQFGNVFLLTSYLAFFIPISLFVIVFRKAFDLLKWPPLIAFSEMTLCIVTSLGLKATVTAFFGIKDDAHIGAILLSKFTSYSDFHTQLYTCAPEFDFLSMEYFKKLLLTLLIPTTTIVMCNILWQMLLFVFGYKNCSDIPNKEEKGEREEVVVSNNRKKISHTKTNSKTLEKSIKSETALDSNQLEVALGYHFFQCLAFVVMATLIMRLKLFLTPLMAVLSGMITSNKVLKTLSGSHRVSITYTLIVVSSVSGLWNLSDQMNIIGEYNNPDLEGLVQWINTSTQQDAVFAGSMPLMATVKLTVERPIVNHPHYEDAGIRARTKLVYSIYSKRSVDIVYSNLRTLGVQYVIMEDIWCNKQYRKGCAFQDIYLEEFPEDINNPLFCLLVNKGKTSLPHFKQVFKNKSYLVLQLSD